MKINTFSFIDLYLSFNIYLFIQGTGIIEALGDEKYHHQEQCNAFFDGYDSKQTSDEEYETDIEENDSDTYNAACIEKSIRASVRVLSGIMPVKGDN